MSDPAFTFSVTRPGVESETMARTIAAPIERDLSFIAGITSIASTSVLGLTRITIQLDPSRDIAATTADVQKAIDAVLAGLPDEFSRSPFIWQPAE